MAPRGAKGWGLRRGVCGLSEDSRRWGGAGAPAALGLQGDPAGTLRSPLCRRSPKAGRGEEGQDPEARGAGGRPIGGREGSLVALPSRPPPPGEIAQEGPGGPGISLGHREQGLGQGSSRSAWSAEGRGLWGEESWSEAAVRAEGRPQVRTWPVGRGTFWSLGPSFTSDPECELSSRLAGPPPHTRSVPLSLLRPEVQGGLRDHRPCPPSPGPRPVPASRRGHGPPLGRERGQQGLVPGTSASGSPPPDPLSDPHPELGACPRGGAPPAGSPTPPRVRGRCDTGKGRRAAGRSGLNVFMPLGPQGGLCAGGHMTSCVSRVAVGDTYSVWRLRTQYL